MREPGTYGLEELISDVDGSDAYRYSGDAVTDLASGSWDMAQLDLDPGIEWVVDDLEDDDLDIAISREAWALFYERTKAHCEGCSGECGR